MSKLLQLKFAIIVQATFHYLIWFSDPDSLLSFWTYCALANLDSVKARQCEHKYANAVRELMYLASMNAVCTLLCTQRLEHLRLDFLCAPTPKFS